MKKLLSTIMAVVMLLSLVPMAVAEGETTANWSETKTEKSVAQVGDMYYDVLYDAVAAVEPGGTVTLLKDATGGGVGTYTDASKKDKLGRDKIVAKSFTLDFAGYTYTVSEPAVGSDGYESQGFHLEKGDGSVSVTLKNGTLASTGAAVKMLVQNYCNLTLDNMTLNGTGIELSTGAYVLSNNCGDVTIRDTTIVARNGDVAFDVYGGFQDYSDVTVTVTGNSVINGKVELARDSKYPNNKNQNKLVIVGGTINGQICKTSGEVVVKGGAFTDLASAVKYAADGATITLAWDAKGDIVIPAGKTITLDLGGHKLTNVETNVKEQQHTIVNNGTLTITGTGTVDNVTHGKAALVNYGTAILNGGNFTRSKENAKNDKDHSGDNSYYTILNDKGATMTINEGVTVSNVGHYSSMIRNGGDNNFVSTMTIKGGTFSGGINTVKNDVNGVLTVSGGDFSNTSQFVIMNWNKATISGGTFEANASAEAVLFVAKIAEDLAVGELKIEGGTYVCAANQKLIIDRYVDNTGKQYPGTAVISAGAFNVAPDAKYLAEGMIVVPNVGKTEYTVQPKTSEDGTVTKVEGNTKTETKTDGNTKTETKTDLVTGATTETKTETKVEGNVTTKTETVTEKNAAGETTKATETVTTEKTENGGKTTVVTKKDTLNKTETTEVTGVTAPTTASDVTLDVKNTTNVAVNKDSMTALKDDTVKDVVIKTKDAKLTLNKTAVKTMEGNVPANGKMTLDVTVTEETNATEITKIAVEVTAKNEAGENVFPENTANTNGLINITIPYTGNAKYLDLWYVAANGSASYMGRFPVVNGFVSFDVKHFSQYDLIPVASSGSSVIKTGAGSSAASTTQTVTTDLTPGSITKVTVDGKVVDAKYYTVSGSNVTFTAEFLKTLKNGSHTVTVENATKIAKGVFTVNNPTTAQSPTTADAGIALYAGMAIASVMGTGVVFTSRKRKNH